MNNSKNTIKIGIVGNVHFNNLELTREVLKAQIVRIAADRDVIIISGEPDIDIMVKEIVTELKLKYKGSPQKVHKKEVGDIVNNTKNIPRDNFFVRNKLISDNSDFLICFINHRQYRSGTWNILNHFTKNEKNVENFLIINQFREYWRKQDYPSWLKKRLNI